MAYEKTFGALGPAKRNAASPEKIRPWLLINHYCPLIVS